MNRRTFALAAAAALASTSAPASGQSQGIKVRFVITRTLRRADGVVEKSSYENAILLAPSERFERALGGYSIGLRAVPAGETVKVEVAIRDLVQGMAQAIRGEATVQMGRGGGIDFPAQDTGLYGVGLLVTQQALPGKGS